MNRFSEGPDVENKILDVLESWYKRLIRIADRGGVSECHVCCDMVEHFFNAYNRHVIQPAEIEDLYLELVDFYKGDKYSIELMIWREILKDLHFELTKPVTAQ